MVNWSMETLQQYYADGSDQVLRIDHYQDEITEKSLVVEIGACTGDFTMKLFESFPCHIVAFEPIPELYDVVRSRIGVGERRVAIANIGISATGHPVRLMVDGPATHLDQEGDLFPAISVESLFRDFKHVDLLVINIEGAEYDLLDRLLDLHLQSCVKNFQIQFHDYFPGADVRMARIQERLRETHELTYQYVFVFENWRRK